MAIQHAVKIKTPKDAKGFNDLKILEKTTANVLQGRIETRSLKNLKHCHILKASRDINRIDAQPWEERVGKILRIHETNRYNHKNALHHAIGHIQILLQSSKIREKKLFTTQLELEKTGNYLKTLLDSMVDSLIVTDMDGSITEVNKAAELMSNYPRDEIIGKPFEEFFIDALAARKGLSRVMEQGSVSDIELTLVNRKKNQVPVMLNATILKGFDNIPNGILINARNISELKKAQEEQERYAAELARANADLEEFAQVTSHDLQEPMKKVTSYAVNLLKKYQHDLDERSTKELNFMIDQTTYMQELVKNVLDYARVDTREEDFFELIDCQKLFAQALENLRGAMEESGAIITHDDLPKIYGNKTHLIRVFQNTVGNAIKYRDKKKENCFVHVAAKRIENLKVPIADISYTKGWLFSIEDNGMGVDPDFLTDIFEMFVRLDPDAEGAGMGLAICRKIISRHGGNIWIESELEKGSTFYFSIPDHEDV